MSLSCTKRLLSSQLMFVTWERLITSILCNFLKWSWECLKLYSHYKTSNNDVIKKNSTHFCFNSHPAAVRRLLCKQKASSWIICMNKSFYFIHKHQETFLFLFSYTSIKQICVTLNCNPSLFLTLQVSKTNNPLNKGSLLLITRVFFMFLNNNIWKCKGAYKKITDS